MLCAMRSWIVDQPGPVASGSPLVRADRDPPEPAPHEIRVRVSTCGVCRTDLHLAEGELAPRRRGVTPGHEAVGIVDARGASARRFEIGDRVGIAWLRSTCGKCRFCRRGCGSAGETTAAPPGPLQSAILFAPAGELVPIALAGLDSGGTLAIAGIYSSDIPVLSYDRHLFRERQLRSVTANTRRDGEEFLAIAARSPIRVTTTMYPFERADVALRDLAAGRVTGAAVVQLSAGFS